MRPLLDERMRGVCKGKTMYVVPYLMAPPTSPLEYLSEHRRQAMSAGASGLSSEDGQMWLRVSPATRSASFGSRWAPSCTRGGGRAERRRRDQVALHIEKAEELQAAESWEKLALRHQAETPSSTLAYRVAGYEAEASRLGAIRSSPRRPAAHLAHQASGDALCEKLAAAPAGAARELLSGGCGPGGGTPFIEAMSGVSVDRLVVRVERR